ncbi:MAG: glycoside hydrolase family 15 protein [Chloroflexi bacterium]|nr:glycoside hydrolase family 15 protein [Chloroflexota bacterium]
MRSPDEAAGNADQYRPISDYAMIGDAHGAALISSDGSIDWCVLPHVDSPALFLRLLDARQGGCFQVRPTASRVLVERRYVDDTNVLETVFRTEHGVVRLRDAFTAGGHQEHAADQEEDRPHEILRVVEGVEGAVEVELRCWVTPDFARQVPEVEQESASVVRWRWAGGEAWLAGSWPLSCDGAAVWSRQVVRAGERLVCVCSDRELAGPSPQAVVRRMDETIAYWQTWAACCQYTGPYRNAVVRSALALKLLTYEPSGAIVAAPTTSLPEEIGGVRNWDYRYCWLRDATFTLYALGLLGYLDEAHDFMHWIERVCMACGTDLQIMYGVQEERDLPEHALDHLSGYRGSRPVRVGNAAHTQRQLDVFGEVIDSAYLYFHKLRGADRYGESLTGPMWDLLRSLVDYVADHWGEPDSGIWEVRGGPQHFLHSKVMCWVALDRGLRLAAAYDLPAPVERWQQERDRLRQAILQQGYSDPAGAFTQAFGSTTLDASALLLPLVGFIDVRDPRMAATIAAIRDRLTRNGLVYRYLGDDGLPGGEGAFSICTFWLVDCLAFAGRVDEARALFETMLGHANPLGLYSEEIDPATGEFLGNFPQGFTHIALINSAVNLKQAESRRASASRANGDTDPAAG